MKIAKAEHGCEFCGKQFQKENSLFAHTCVKKQRWMNKGEKITTVAHMAWERFYKLTSPSRKKELTYKDFVESRYYNDFIKLGFLLATEKVVNPQGFMDYLFKNAIKSKDWTKESVYETYLREFLGKEDMLSAIIRSLKYISNWASETKNSESDFFKLSNTNVVVQGIRTGQISPWLIYVSDNSNDLLDRFDDSQLNLMGKLFDPNVWRIRIRKNSDMIPEVKQLLSEVGL